MLSKFEDVYIDTTKISYVGRIRNNEFGWGFLVVCDGSNIFIDYTTPSLALTSRDSFINLLSEKYHIKLEAPAK